MKRVLIASPEPLRSVMAGMGIRCWEMARVLAADNRVTLAIPNDPREAPPPEGFKVARLDRETAGRLGSEADVAIALGHASNLLLDSGYRKPLVIDLYDPYPIENLNYTATLGREPYLRDRWTLERQLRSGDLFLCSSQEQRLFYLGMLFALGRLNPETYGDDVTLRNLVRIVPFGVPGQAPRSGAPVLRGVVQGIGPDDPVVFFGGVYEWHDPMTLLEALPELLKRWPALRVIFSSSPHPDSTPQETLAAVADLARSRGWLERHVFIVPWAPYDSRASLYLESTVGVVLHRPRFETEISMRTRVLDFLWGGLPVVATEGGGASRLLRDNDMGLTVPVGDAGTLAARLGTLLESRETRDHLAESGRRWSSVRTWERVLEPLREFVSDPRVDPHKSRYGETARPFEETGGPKALSLLRWLIRKAGGRR